MLDFSIINEENINQIIENRINELEQSAIKTKEIGNVERADPNASHHKGFISRDTKVCYSCSQGYYIKTTDYIKEFIEYVKKNNLSPSAKTIFNFLNYYFGTRPSVDVRNERYFKEISDFKHSDKALCTERASIANNILSFMGVESYFCDGSVYSSDGSTEAHAFVITRGKSGQYKLYDPTYSVFYANEDHPFIKNINEETAKKILNSQPNNISRDNCLKLYLYYTKIVDGETKLFNSPDYRIYGVGLQKEDILEAALDEGR